MDWMKLILSTYIFIICLAMFAAGFSMGKSIGYNEGFKDLSNKTQQAFIEGKNSTCNFVTEQQLRFAIREGSRNCDLNISDEDLIIYNALRSNVTLETIKCEVIAQ
jgi:hypothetical protein